MWFLVLRIFLFIATHSCFVDTVSHLIFFWLKIILIKLFFPLLSERLCFLRIAFFSLFVSMVWTLSENAAVTLKWSASVLQWDAGALGWGRWLTGGFGDRHLQRDWVGCQLCHVANLPLTPNTNNMWRSLLGPFSVSREGLPDPPGGMCLAECPPRTRQERAARSLTALAADCINNGVLQCSMLPSTSSCSCWLSPDLLWLILSRKWTLVSCSGKGGHGRGEGANCSCFKFSTSPFFQLCPSTPPSKEHSASEWWAAGLHCRPSGQLPLVG